jgi:hypothetical protein
MRIYCRGLRLAAALVALGSACSSSGRKGTTPNLGGSSPVRETGVSTKAGGKAVRMLIGARDSSRSLRDGASSNSGPAAIESGQLDAGGPRSLRNIHRRRFRW